MKNYFILCSLFLLSCASKSNLIKINAQNEGFTEMTIIESKNISCEFLLKDSKSNLYEVQEIESKIPDIKSEKKIWVKFTPLRKMSVCNAQPISIDEVILVK